MALQAPESLRAPGAPAAAHTMRAAVYRGRKHVRVEERPRPALGDARDAIVRVTTAAICGSDLHLYHYAVPGLGGRVVLGHELVGVVDEVGGDVRRVRAGDRVAVSGIIADGTCRMCRRGLFSQCESTNPNPLPKLAHGHPHGAILGFGPLTGGYDGGQAEYARIPIADVNLLPIPEDVSDEQAVFLSDVLCVAWEAARRAEAGPRRTVAVWGCGPVGLCAMECARAMGAERFVAIDCVPERLALARQRFGADVINFDAHDPVPRILALTGGEGADACIEAAGFRYAKSIRHKLQRGLLLETDALDTVTEMIRAATPGGACAVAGFYAGFANQFPIGALMEKEVTLRGVTAQPQRDGPMLLERVRAGEIDPTFTITHRLPLDAAPEAYRVFDEKRDGAIKILLQP